MKSKNFLLICAAVCSFFAAIDSSRAQGTAFIYQGRLNTGTNPANGSFDFAFALLSVSSGAGQVGVTLTNLATPVTNGLFSVALDFGNQFPGAARWLEIGVRTNGGGVFSTLSPRQALTATPYSTQAANFSGPVAASQITGTLASSNIGSGTIVGGDIAAGAITGSQLASGAAAANLNASSQSGVASGGLVLSTTANNAALVNAGYINIGTTTTLDSWLQHTNGTPPAARGGHTAVWTGSEMIVWGGGGSFPTLYNDGGIYNPASDSWTAVTTTSAPSARSAHTAVWTGSKMIVWGGAGTGIFSYLNTGGSYDPVANSWTPVTTNGAPTARQFHTAVWTGSEMIVWGGLSFTVVNNDGGRYNPASDSWVAVTTNGAPSGRYEHTAVWSGSEMIVWGGNDHTNALDDGGRFDPSTGGWTPSNQSAPFPIPRYLHSAVWTGSEMIIWGGTGGSSVIGDGWRFNPSSNTWTAVNSIGAPEARQLHTAVWTGNQMIVWGGFDGTNTYFNDGALYNPEQDNWTPMTPASAPAGRDYHTAVWTDSDMIIFGGSNGNGPLGDTYTYAPPQMMYLYQRP